MRIEKRSHCGTESVVFINDDFYVFVADGVIVLGGGVGGSHNFMVAVNLDEDNFPEHEVVVDEDDDETQLYDRQNRLDDQHHEVGRCLWLNRLADDDGDHDNPQQQT